MENKKDGFGSKIGFVLAAAGSAVGLGNIWRFPYLAAKYGGGIFLLVYAILAVTFGFSLMVTEIAIGRRTGKSVIGAYSDICKKFKPLCFVAAAVPVMIFSYYCVIGGWVLKYFTVYIENIGMEAANDNFFSDFIASPFQPTIFLIIFLLLTAVVVMLGVEKGIEKVSKLLMPVLVVITVGISIYCITIDGAMAGVKYYLMPEFANFSIKTVVAAMGQLFYSMSIAMGIMVTFGSYMRKEDNIEEAVRYVEIFDTAIAFLSGLMIIPAVFAFSGGDASALGQGPGLMFVTLPKVFLSMKAGRFLGLVFFILVALAALTSAISLMETIVSVIMEKWKMKRTKACIITTLFSFVLGMFSVLGYSTFSEVKIFGKQFLDFLDFFSNNLVMPIVALFTCILIGYIAKPSYVEDEVMLSSQFRSRKLYSVMIKYVCPVCMLIILVSSAVGYV